MKQLFTIIGIFGLLLLVACTPSQPEAGAPIVITITGDEAEEFAQATPEQIEQELDTGFIDDIEQDLELLIIE